MSITIKLERAMGYLELNKMVDEPHAPKFIGRVGLAHYDADEDNFSWVVGTAWSRKIGHEEYLTVHLLGLQGELQPNIKFHPDDPDFVGTLGPDKQLFVMGSVHVVHGVVRGLQVDFADRGCSRFDKSFHRNASADSDFI